jgi:excinuclease ABC subunit C
MMHDSLTNTIKQLPSEPGVYQYYDRFGKLLYVGKAKNLKNRVSSYFQTRADHSPRIALMVKQVVRLEYIIAPSELDALILEATLIKTHRPRYNILLRDGKKYPWLRLSKGDFPRLEITREPKKDGARYFGPYPSSSALYETLNLVKTIFPLRKRRKPLFKDRPCMNYHIGTCLGPCQNLVSPDEYAIVVKQLGLFLRGQSETVLDMLQTQMLNASEQLQFEKAALYRDRYEHVKKVLHQQRVVFDDPSLEQDIFGVCFTDNTGYVAQLLIRNGRLIQTRFFEFDRQDENPPEDDYYQFLNLFYEERIQQNQRDDVTLDIPREIVLQYAHPDGALLADWLSQTRKDRKLGKVSISVPQRPGQKQDGLSMAIRNAEESKDSALQADQNKHASDPMQALLLLQEKLGLASLPKRMECYDISHVQGTHTVASMVVFTNGMADKAEYKRFKIQSTEEGTPDDFKSMAEVMTRRFQPDKANDEKWPTPDLVIIDGGKGQLSSAIEALQALGIENQAIISLAKKFEEVFLPGQTRPIIIERESRALYLLQRIRDEAHRFAITYHRSLRGKAQTASILDTVVGLGPKRKAKLLSHFGSLTALQKANLSEFQTALGNTGKISVTLFEQICLKS